MAPGSLPSAVTPAPPAASPWAGATPAPPEEAPAVLRRRVARDAIVAPGTVATATALVAIVALVCWPWMGRTMPWNDLPDAAIHLVRLYVVFQALARGEWYPRWLSDLYLGYGYPLLNYYAPGLYYLGALLHALGLSIYRTFQVAGAIGVTAGATGAYALAASHYRRRDTALLAAASYALAPYPFFTNLYVRGDVPEVLALGLLPWLLRAAWGAWQGSLRWSIVLALLTAALTLTHNVTALFGFPLLAAWLLRLLATSWHGGPARAARLRLIVVAIAAGLGLSAFFWLPSLLEMRQVRMSLVQSGLFDFRNWLFDPLALRGGTAAADYPHTRLGIADLALRFRYDALTRQVPEKIALPQVLLWGTGTVAALAEVVIAGRRSRSSTIALTWSLLAAGLLFLNTTWSAWLWQHLPLLAAVQFPWRLYGPLALCVALVAGGLASLTSPAASRSAQFDVHDVPSTSNSSPSLALIEPAGSTRLTFASTGSSLLVFACTLLLAFNAAIALRPHRSEPPPAHDVDIQTMLGEEYDKFAAGTTSGGEFLPTTVDWPKYRTGVWQGIRLYEQAYDEAGWQAGLVRVLDGEAAVTGITRSATSIGATVDVASASRIAFHQLLFTGWRATVDGHATPLQAATYSWSAPDPPHERVDASLGFMVLDVPPGRHQVAVTFGATPPRVAGATLTVATLTAALLWLTSRAFGAGISAAALALVATLAGGAAAFASYHPPLASPEKPRVVLDVATAVRAGAPSFSPAGRGQGLAPPFLDLRYLAIAGESRRWLFMHPPSSAALTLQVPPHAYFQTGLGMDPETWSAPVGDGVRFILEAQTPAGQVTLLDRRVNPRARGEDRQWLDEWISLEPFAGQTVQLTLRTDAAEEPSYDWAGWANPQVVIWDGTRPDPGIPHKF